MHLPHGQRDLGRRRLLAGAGAALLAGTQRAGASGPALDALARKAGDEPPLVWYESSPQELLDRIARLYAQRFPGLRMRPLRLVGGGEMVGRIVQETQAGAPTADVGTSGLDQTWQLAARGLLGEEDWPVLGIPESLVISRFAVAAASSIHGILVNTRQIPDALAPREWEDLLDSQWHGRIGTWVTTTPLVMLAKRWGRERTERFVAGLAAQRPYLYKSLFGVAQAVAVGEVSLGIVAYHTALPAINAGAPVRLVMPDPISLSTQANFVTSGSRSPNAARLFVAWLASADGAASYESVIGRGVHLAYPTRTAAFVAGKEVAEFMPADRELVNAMRTQFNRLLASAGRAAD